MSEKNLILFFLTIGGVSLGLSMPTLNEQVVLTFGSKGIAVEQFTELISTALTCFAYRYARTRDIIKKTLLIAFVISVTITVIVVIVTIDDFNPLIFLISHLISFGVLSSYIGRSVTGLRAWIFADPKKREDYDNSKNLWVSIGGLVGFGISSFLVIPLKISLILYIVSVLGTLGWAIVFIRHKKEYLGYPLE